MTEKVYCFHLVDGIIMFGSILSETKTEMQIIDPLVLTKYYSDDSILKLMFSKYDNFAEPDIGVTLYKNSVISKYHVKQSSKEFYEIYVKQLKKLEEEIDESDIDWQDDVEIHSKNETMSSITNGIKPLDINTLRKETLRVVVDNTDKDE